VKLAVQKAIERLTREKLIARYGDKKGNYRILEVDCDVIDWMSATGKTLDVKWPLGIDQFVETMPGNIIVVAGEPNSGKTAWLLNVVQMNMDKFEVNYYSSEMGPNELKKRIEKFHPDVMTHEWKFTAYERSTNFADVIKPGEGIINIIDFMEIHDDFWKVGGLMKDIHDKLNGAIAVIAIQKNKGNDFGIGGTRGLEKPRLYLTMAPNMAKIIKAKNWKTMENPNGLVIEYSLARGCKFYPNGPWHKEPPQEESNNGKVLKYQKK
jgi:hypothetical protein